MSLDGLTNREIQIMLGISYDYSTKEIAHLLNISHKTVANMRQRLYVKIKKNSSVGVTRFAVARGYVSLADEVDK